MNSLQKMSKRLDKLTNIDRSYEETKKLREDVKQLSDKVVALDSGLSFQACIHSEETSEILESLPLKCDEEVEAYLRFGSPQRYIYEHI
jgi:hypothetical protein